MEDVEKEWEKLRPSVKNDYEKKKKELAMHMAERMKKADARYECVITVESDYVAQSSPDDK